MFVCHRRLPQGSAFSFLHVYATSAEPGALLNGYAHILLSAQESARQSGPGYRWQAEQSGIAVSLGHAHEPWAAARYCKQRFSDSERPDLLGETRVVWLQFPRGHGRNCCIGQSEAYFGLSVRSNDLG